MAEVAELSYIQCGKEAAKHFAFDNAYRNLNHGEC